MTTGAPPGRLARDHPLARFLSDRRTEINRSVATARLRFPGFRTEPLEEGLLAGFARAAEVVAVGEPRRIPSESTTFFDGALHLLLLAIGTRRYRCGPAAPLDDLFDELLPLLAERFSSERGLETLALLLNAGERLGARARSFYALAKRAAAHLTLENSRRVGYYLAWAAGEGRWRDRAIEAIDEIPDALLLDLGGLERVPTPSRAGAAFFVRSTLRLDPWRGPMRPLSRPVAELLTRGEPIPEDLAARETTLPTWNGDRPVVLLAETGGFEGLGGPFRRLPVATGVSPHAVALSEGGRSFRLRLAGPNPALEATSGTNSGRAVTETKVGESRLSIMSPPGELDLGTLPAQHRGPLAALRRVASLVATPRELVVTFGDSFLVRVYGPDPWIT